MDRRGVYSFGPFRMDSGQGILATASGEIPLTPKAFDTLCLLVQKAGSVVPKKELMSEVWPDSYVDENNLAQSVSLVRKALASADPAGTYVQTIPRRGYRFVAPVSLVSGEEVPASPLVLPDPHDQAPLTRYARSGEVNIAYQVIGEGPVDLVFVMGWVSHLEMFWAEPSFARFLRRLAGFSRLILFDKRGTGLSDSVPLSQLPTLEQRMDDVRAVMDAAGSRKAVLMGVSEGGTMATLFAATYPEHTAGIVIIGGYARRLWAPDYPWGPTVEQRDQFIEALELEWGGPFGIEVRAPSKADDPAFRQWWGAYLRMGASPGAAAALTRMNAEIDVRHVLPSVRVPTLVIHRRDDRCLKVEEGRYLAERIPGARFVELPGNDHLPFVGDQEEILGEVEPFVGELEERAASTRVLTTLLFVLAPAPIDLEALRELDDQAAREVAWFNGRKLGVMGQGILASFDGPARAIHCAGAILDAARAAGIPLSAGLHTGECDLGADTAPTGPAVRIAKTVAVAAGPGEVLVSNTVRDLVAGSGIRFEPREPLSLGEMGPWNTFAVARGR